VIGEGTPVRVESMLKVPLSDLGGCLQELRELAEAGCEMVRIAFPDLRDRESLALLVAEGILPIMADIHFDARLAVGALEAGCPSIRVNPGNLGGEARLLDVLAAARERGAVLRIGANGGSLNRRQIEDAGGDQTLALTAAVEEQVRPLVDRGFEEMILSAKATSVPVTVRANRLLAERWPFPFHVGITEAGTGMEGAAKSAVGIGLLLASGIGDTLRVSLTGPSVDEVRVGYSILRALEIRKAGATLISCPACGRRRIDVADLVDRVRPLLKRLPDGAALAVMGCEVNGPREAAGADYGVAGAAGGVLLFRRGRPFGTVPFEEAPEALERLISRGDPGSSDGDE
jgi:(E)-4-hydroxy-3-methylbut-2-enyl-diphosphate synthase